MGKKSNFVAVQRFSETQIADWRERLGEEGANELFEAIMVPEDTPSQLKAAKKV